MKIKQTTHMHTILCILLTLAFQANPVPAAAQAFTPIEEVLFSHYKEWKGTRYRLGGNSDSGLDCSSFIQQLFAKRFGLDIPRSAREQMVQGWSVRSDELKAGDLLFFRSGPTRRHVAVYLGRNRFLHVSASRGVGLDSLLEPYWQRRLLTARRLLS